MNVIDKKLSFRAMTKRSKTTRIILHHAAATKCTVEDVHRWHSSYGWAGIGYHYFVSKDGKIYKGRPEDMVGSHASGHNADSIGICFEGNFENDTMSDAQKAAGKELVADIKARYNITKVQKHSDVNATACPGKNFPYQYITAETKTAKKKKVSYRAHIETYDWQPSKVNGEMAGTTEQAKRLEALVINSKDAEFEYKGHIQDEGDTEWVTNGHIIGTMGEGKRLEAVWIKCSKPIKYRVHVQDVGWMPWVKNGEMAGTIGEAKRLEAIEIEFA